MAGAHIRLADRYEYVVDFGTNMSSEEVRARLKPFEVLVVERVGRYSQVVVETNLSCEDALRKIRSLEGVKFAEPNVKYFKKNEPNSRARISATPGTAMTEEAMTLGNVAAWLPKHVSPDDFNREIRIALIGSQPDPTDSRLAESDRFRIVQTSGVPSPYSASDTGTSSLAQIGVAQRPSDRGAGCSARRPRTGVRSPCGHHAEPRAGPPGALLLSKS